MIKRKLSEWRPGAESAEWRTMPNMKWLPYRVKLEPIHPISPAFGVIVHDSRAFGSIRAALSVSLSDRSVAREPGLVSPWRAPRRLYWHMEPDLTFLGFAPLIGWRAVPMTLVISHEHPVADLPFSDMIDSVTIETVEDGLVCVLRWPLIRTTLLIYQETDR